MSRTVQTTAGADPSPEQQPPDTIDQLIRQVRPRLRGWLHAAAAPLALAAGIVLMSLAPTAAGAVGSAVFLAASVLLFGTSGIFHRFTWGPRGYAVLSRLDHANIYVFIAATYTPLALLLLTGPSQMVLLGVIWAVALSGLLFRLFWFGAPRWLYTMLYVVIGWTALGWLGEFLQAGSPAVLLLIFGGGVCYTAGAVVYGAQRPDPSPRWFGFHEIFHACTIAGFACHYVAISMITYAAA